MNKEQFLFLAEARRRQEEHKKNAVSHLRGIPTSTLQGITADWGDELIGGINAGIGTVSDWITGDNPHLTISDRYKMNRDAIRDSDKRYSTDNQGIDLTANIAGGMVPVSKALQTPGYLRSMGVGAGYGGANYLGTRDKMEDTKFGDMAIDTATGGVLGLGGQALSDVISAVYNRVKGTPLMNKMLAMIKEETGKSTEEILSAGRKMGIDLASFADVTDRAGITMLQAVRQKGDGKVDNIIEKNYSKITDGRERIRSELEGQTGVVKNTFPEMVRSAKDTRKQRANLNYGQALDNQFMPFDKELSDLINDVPIARDAWYKVINKEYKKGNKVLPPLDDRTVMPSMKSIQKMKWELDALISNRMKSTDSKGKDELRDLIKVREQLLDRAYAYSPEFRRANDEFAGDSKIIDAFDDGRKDGLSNNYTDIQLDNILRMTAGEREAYKQGVFAKSYNQLGRGNDSTLGNIGDMQSDNARQVMTSLIGPDRTKAMQDVIGRERRFRSVENKVMQGSETALRERAGKELFSKEALDLLNMTPTGRVLTTIKRVLEPSQKDLAKIADLLSKPGGIEEFLAEANKTLSNTKYNALNNELKALAIANHEQMPVPSNH